MDGDNLTGYPTATFSAGSSEMELPIHHLQSTEGYEDLLALYGHLVSQVKQLAPQTTEFLDGSKTPVIDVDSGGLYTLDRFRLTGGGTVSGSGTLLVMDVLRLDKGAVLNWEGNIIVMGDDQNHAELDVHDGQLNVKGSVIVLGEGKDHVDLKIKARGSVNVEGALFVGTSADDDEGRRARLTVDGDGQLSVNGMLSFFGSKVETRLKHDSNVAVEGMMQVALVDAQELKMEFDGKLDVRKSDKEILGGIEALEALGEALEIPQTTESLLTEEMLSYAWQQL